MIPASEILDMAGSLALAGDEECLATFQGMANEVARRVADNEISKGIAIDQLYELAIARGLTDLYGETTVQAAMAYAFENGANGGVTPAKAKANGKTDKGKPKPPILSLADFVKGFQPPDYLIEGVLQRRFIYALTGQTGHAKTAVALLIARAVSSVPNSKIGPYEAEKGRVIYFVGENPDDVRMRVIGAAHERRTDPKRLDKMPDEDNISFIPGVFNIEEMAPIIAEDMKVNGEAALIIVDTSAAYFLGNEEQSNTQMGNYARILRTLTTLPGGPCVLVLCHPIKHVDNPAQLLPRGGGAYLAEVDGNLTLWRTGDDRVELYYNKMRGPGFQPIAFKLVPIKNESLKDAKGRRISTVEAQFMTPTEEEQKDKQAEQDQDRVLAAMLKNPANDGGTGSLAEWAKDIDWVNEIGAPYKKKVERTINDLDKQKPRLVTKDRQHWVLTEEGKTRARKAAIAFQSQGQESMQFER